MKILKKTILLTLSLLSFIASIQGQAEVTTTKTKNATADLLLACGDHFQLTDEVSMYNDISVVGDYVAWGNIFGDINLYKISTDEIIPIYTGTDFDFNSWVQLDEAYLYFNTEMGGFRKYNLLDGTISFLYSNGFNTAMVGGNHMASAESVGGVNLEIFYKDLTSTSDAVNISNNPDTDRFFFVGENAIAWVNSNTTEEKLMVYLPADGTNQGAVIVTTPNTSALDIHRPIIVGNQVYFSKRNGDFYQLWAYDIQTAAAPVLLLDLSSDHYINAAHGDYLVLRNNDQIKLYHTSNGTTIDLPNSNNNGATRINDQYVFWENETLATGVDIFRYDIALQQTSNFVNTLAQDFLIHISDDYAVYSQGDMVEDHLFIDNLIPLGIEDDVIEPQTGSTPNGLISLRVVGSVGGVTYAWSGPNGFTSDTEDIANLESGEYTLVVTDGNGCTTSYTGIVDRISSVVSLNSSNGMELYPSPANEVIQIAWTADGQRLDNTKGQVEIFDVHGRTMPLTALARTGDKSISVSIATWESGIYFVRMRFKDDVVQSSFVKL